VKNMLLPLLSTLSLALPAAAQHEPTRDQAWSEIPFATTLETEVVEVGMEHRSGHVLVDVWIHAEGPYQFVLDTCAGGHGCIDASLAEELGLEQIGRVATGDGTGENGSFADLVRVEALQVGDAAFEGLRMVITPEAVSGQASLGRGILGIGLFRELMLTLDYGKSKVRITDASLDSKAPNVVPLYQGSGVPEIDIQIGETSMRAHVDSGNMGGLLLPGSYKETLELGGELRSAGQGQTIANNFEMWAAPLAESLAFAGHELVETDASFADIFRTANLGYGVLSRYELTIDSKNSLAAFVPVSTVARPPTRH